jgi:hypothetical protein
VAGVETDHKTVVMQFTNDKTNKKQTPRLYPWKTRINQNERETMAGNMRGLLQGNHNIEAYPAVIKNIKKLLIQAKKDAHKASTRSRKRLDRRTAKFRGITPLEVKEQKRKLKNKIKWKANRRMYDEYTGSTAFFKRISEREKNQNIWEIEITDDQVPMRITIEDKMAAGWQTIMNQHHEEITPSSTTCQVKGWSHYKKESTL